MKNLLFFTALSLLFTYCSFEEPQLVLFNPEAFAYSLDNGWEVNATIGAKGFQQNDKDDNYSASLSYSVDLITPVDTIQSADTGTVDESSAEEFIDLMIETQFELNENFELGEYQIIFYVEDNYSNTKDTMSAQFYLTVE